MIIIGIDPGKTTGVAVYDAAHNTVLEHTQISASEVWPDVAAIGQVFDEVCETVDRLRCQYADVRVAVERVTLYGIGNGQIEATIRLEDRITHILAAPAMHIRRGDVLRHFGVPKATGTDARVRLVLQERFGEGCFRVGRACSKRKNKSHGGGCHICHGTGMEREPGDLYGMGEHSRDALALAIAAHELGAERCK